MGEKTNIEWCDSTVNPTTGCDGCELWNGRDIRICYAGNLHEGRLAKSIPKLYAPDFREVRLAPGRMMKAARWPDLRGQERPDKPWLNGLPRMIFVGDMGDFMSRKVPDEYVKREIIGAITSREGSRHFWLLLTKQIHRLFEFSLQLGGLPDNCMAMTTITGQAVAGARIADLTMVNCKWRGISAEPLWEEVVMPRETMGRCCGCQTCQFQGWHQIAKPKIDWVIVGGQSGSDPKTFYLDHARSMIAQCKAAGVDVFVKQLGAAASDEVNGVAGYALKVPQEAAPLISLRLRDKKGGDINEWPPDLQIRQMPDVSR